MADLIFKFADSYAKIYNRLPRLAIEYDSKTRRYIAISNIKKLLGSIFNCLVIMWLFTEGPKLLQFFYLVHRSVELGHFPTMLEEPFASPTQLLSIAIITITSGAAPILAGIAYLFNTDIVKFLNELLNLEDDLVQRGIF